MRRHLELVRTLFIIWGGLCLVISLSLVALGLAALAMAGSAGQQDTRLTAMVLGALFLAVAALAFVFGICHLWAAAALPRGREWTRVSAMVLAVIDLVFVPLGTAVGIYTLRVMGHSETRVLFAPPAASTST